MTTTEYPDGALYNADCLEAIATLPDNSVDCVITDPPYFLGMTHNGQRGNFLDLSICRPFYRELFTQMRRVGKESCSYYFFCDWRSYAFYYPIFDEVIKAHNMLVWDKVAGAGNFYAFRYELLLFHMGKGVQVPGANIITGFPGFSGGAKRTNGEKVHPTQKPVELIAKFITDATKPGGVILDTFGGSGTTAMAAVRTGRRFIVMEQSENYYDIARKRIEQAYVLKVQEGYPDNDANNQTTLF